MSKFDTFTVQQKETHKIVHDLEEQYMAALDPAFFVLNQKLEEIKAKITDAQAHCNHIFENGFCIVCNKEEAK